MYYTKTIIYKNKISAQILLFWKIKSEKKGTFLSNKVEGKKAL